MLAVTVVTAALIIVLSVFNGFDSIIRKFYNAFDPDIKIISTEAKFFTLNLDLQTFLDENPNVACYSLVCEENAMLKYNDKQIIATIKGVDNNFEKLCGIDTMIRRGEYLLSYENTPLAVAAWGIAYNLQLDFDFINPVTVFMPSRTKNLSGNIANAQDNINTLHIYTAGAFSTFQEEYDSKYFIIPLAEAQKLLEFKDEISSIEVKLKDITKFKTFIKDISAKFGKDYKFLDRNKQHEATYKILKSEKLMIFIILLFILLIASFNLIASLSMLVIDKQQDIEIFKSMGANDKSIRKIFFIEGLLINIIGVFFGLIFGTIICFLQIKFGLISLGEGTYLIQNYPVEIKIIDYLYIFIGVICIGLLTSLLPLKLIKRGKIIPTLRS